jgi:predicted alpha/beta hydrolase family esterase
MNNYFIIHGSYGSPSGNWFPWLKEVLTSKGKVVTVPQFPTPEGQNYENWEKVLNTYVDKKEINENTVFIAHSISPIFVCKFLIKNKIKVKGLISVAGANNFITGDSELDKITSSFFMDNNELEKIIDYTGFVYCFYSNNDPYIPFENLEEFAKLTRGEKCLIEKAGHLNAESGYLEFKPILEVIEQSENHMTFFESDDLPIGINAIVLNDKGEMLLARRANRFGAGTYGLIGGKLKFGETFEKCMKRELKEEANLDVEEEDLEIINLANTITNKHFLQIGILVKKYKGTPTNMEPNKCDDIGFFDINNMPELFVATKPNIMLYKNKQFYNKDENV